jgi:hypothetical protein
MFCQRDYSVTYPGRSRGFLLVRFGQPGLRRMMT